MSGLLARVPPMPFVAAVILVRCVARWCPWRVSGARAIGVALVLGGLALDGWAILTQVRAGTSPVPDGRHTRLVTWGPYAYSRNPIYIAHTLVALGAALVWTRSAWAVLGAACAWFVTDRVTVPIEERALEAGFPTEYAAYRRSVGRWWGRG